MPLTSGVRALEQLLLPAECLLCRGLLGFEQGGRLVCDVCRHRWRPVRPPWCERCGTPEPLFGSCRTCATWPEALTRVRAAVWLDEAARAAVHALKYQGLPRLSLELAEVMVRHVARPAAPAVLVPVPLGMRRRRERGYNQCEHLADALGRLWTLPVDPARLIRVRDTPSQTALTPAARRANVAGCFAPGHGPGVNPPGQAAAIRGPGVGSLTPGHGPGVNPSAPTLVLVDDVLTTGATLAEAGRALEAAGAPSVEAVTFGRAVIPDFT